MKILVSYPSKLENEIELIHQEMRSGNWDLFHLRKPGWSSDEVMKLLSGLSDEVRKKTVVHEHIDLVEKFDLKGGHLKMNELSTINYQLSTSCHSFEEVEKIEGEKGYCFLSPVFDSISKPGYKANFDKEELKEFLKKDRKIKVIGLGGVTEDNYYELLELGFDGGAFLGSVWEKYLIRSSDIMKVRI